LIHKRVEMYKAIKNVTPKAGDETAIDGLADDLDDDTGEDTPITEDSFGIEALCLSDNEEEDETPVTPLTPPAPVTPLTPPAKV